MERRPTPSIAWLLAGGTGIALAVLAVAVLSSHGTNSFFLDRDAYFFRATALDPFGTGRSFVRVGWASDIPYRYGRIGLPLLSWILALGRPQLVPWTLLGIDLAAIAAIPGLAAVLLAEYGAPPLAGAVVLATPLLFIRGDVYAEPLLIATILLAYILESRRCPRSALVVFAYAVLVKEIAVLALIPWVWRALRRRDFTATASYAATLVPYAIWCVWLRVRVGEFPFLAHTISRTQALGWPGEGMYQAFQQHMEDHVVIVTILLATIALCVIGAVVSRRWPISGFTATLALLTACLGQNALRYPTETLRLLVLPQVFALLCFAVAISNRRASQSPRDSSDQAYEMLQA